MDASSGSSRRSRSGCPTGKEAFASRYAAERVLFQYQIRRHFALKRAYRCPSCRAWHLTSKP